MCMNNEYELEQTKIQKLVAFEGAFNQGNITSHAITTPYCKLKHMAHFVLSIPFESNSRNIPKFYVGESNASGCNSLSMKEKQVIHYRILPSMRAKQCTCYCSSYFSNVDFDVS